MKQFKVTLMLLMTVLLMVACGGGSKSGGSESSSSESISGLKDGEWPASVYDQFGIPQPETKGKVVFTNLQGEENPMWEVLYRGVTHEELLAWVKTLTDKGFRMTDITREHIENGRESAMIYLPEENQNVCIKLYYYFREEMKYEYWTDEPNPAFAYEEGQDDSDPYFIPYNVDISLQKLDNKSVIAGEIPPLKLKAEELKDIPHLRAVSMSGKEGAFMMSIGIGFYRDHMITKEDIDAAIGKVSEVLAAKGAKFYGTLSEEPITVEQIKEKSVRSYQFEMDGKRYLLMNMSDTRVGDIGGGVDLKINTVKK